MANRGQPTLVTGDSHRMAAVAHAKTRDPSLERKDTFTLAPGSPTQLLAIPDAYGAVRRTAHQEQVVPSNGEMGHGAVVLVEGRRENTLGPPTLGVGRRRRRQPPTRRMEGTHGHNPRVGVGMASCSPRWGFGVAI